MSGTVGSMHKIAKMLLFVAELTTDEFPVCSYHGGGKSMSGALADDPDKRRRIALWREADYDRYYCDVCRAELIDRTGYLDEDFVELSGADEIRSAMRLLNVVRARDETTARLLQKSVEAMKLAAAKGD